MLVPSWAKSAAGVALAVGLIAGPSYCAGRSHANATVNAAALKTIHDAADSLHRRTVQDSLERDRLRHVTDSLHAALDTLHAQNAQLAAHVATLMQRVTIQSPTVIAVDTGTAGHSAPPVLATVPPQVTGLIQSLEAQSAAQAEEIVGLRTETATLRAALAVSDSGWTHEKALRVEREREIAILQSQHSRFGFKTGVVFGALAFAGAVYAAGRIDRCAVCTSLAL